MQHLLSYKLFEKISDDQAIRKAAKDAWDKALPKLLKKEFVGSFKFDIQVPSSISAEKTMVDKKVLVQFSPKFDGSDIRPTDDGYKIRMSTTYLYDKEKIDGKYVSVLNEDEMDALQSTYFHEIQHVFQHHNDFLSSDKWNDMMKFKQKKDEGKLKKFKYSDYYNKVSHGHRRTEHEAVLVQYLEMAKLEKWKYIEDHVLNSTDYFNFDFKSFVKKAHYLGLSKEQINRFIKCVNDKLVKKFDAIKNEPFEKFEIVRFPNVYANILKMTNLYNNWYDICKTFFESVKDDPKLGHRLNVEFLKDFYKD